MPPTRLSSNSILLTFTLFFVAILVAVNSGRFLATKSLERVIRLPRRFPQEFSTTTLDSPFENFTGPDLFHPFPLMEIGKVAVGSNAIAQALEDNKLQNPQDGNLSTPELPHLFLDSLRENKSTNQGGAEERERARAAEEKAKTICEEYPYTCEDCDPQAMRKVVSVSLYGNNKRSFVYYKHLPSIAANVKLLFGSDWVLRVYTDSPANVSALLKGVQIVDMKHLDCLAPSTPTLWRSLDKSQKTNPKPCNLNPELLTLNPKP